MERKEKGEVRGGVETGGEILSLALGDRRSSGYIAISGCRLSSKITVFEVELATVDFAS